MVADQILSERLAEPQVSMAWTRHVPTLIVIGCVLFNFFLCFVNTVGMRISGAYIVMSEMSLVSIALAYAFFSPDRDRCVWLIVIMSQFILLSVLSVLRDEVLFKSLRDVMIMPVFIALGLASRRTEFTAPLLWLSAFVCLIALFEAFFLNTYTGLFSIKDFFIAKGYDASSFQYTDADVFVSGIRPGGRFFPFPFAIHRISSVFLEPVSLGFYAFISGLYFIAMKDRLPRGQVLLAVFLTLLLIWLGDARMAFGSLVAVIACRPIFARLDHRLSVFIFPAALLFGLFVVESGMFNLTGEGLGARLLWTFNGIWSTGNNQFLGIRPYDKEMVDSGFLYLMSYQGIGGFLLYWLPPIFFRGGFSREARIYWYGASIFLTSGFLVSDAIFTIKTAALLWFGYGYVIARTCGREKALIPS
jgi:putative polymerase